MKCPKCNGKGYCFVSEAWGEADLVCEQCKGKGEVDENNRPILTNEEWLEQASTEEKAKFLRKIYLDGRDDYVGEWYEQEEEDFVEWLKEKHE